MQSVPRAVATGLSPCNSGYLTSMRTSSNWRVERHRHTARLPNYLPLFRHVVTWRQTRLNRSLSQSLQISLHTAEWKMACSQRARAWGWTGNTERITTSVSWSRDSPDLWFPKMALACPKRQN